MFIFLFGIIFTALANAGTDLPGHCDDMSALKDIRKIPVEADINFFMRSSPQTKELGFATNLNKKKPVNKVLNSISGQIRDVPGFIDPVPSPDGSIIATPIEKSFDPVSGSFIKDLNRPYYYLEEGKVKYCKEGEKKCTPTNVKEFELRNGKVPFKMLTMSILDREGNELLIDSQVSSFYQTLGQFNSTPNEVNYRLLYETPQGLAIRDYKRSTSDGKFAPALTPKPLCAGKILALPSLSKNGQELSAFDPITNETHVYKIGKSGDECEIKEKFSGMLGKTDFSPDGKKLAFHVDHASATKNSIFDMPGQDQDLAAFVYDRDKKTFRQLLNVEGEQSYFPVFLADDELALVTAKKNSKGENESFAISLGRLQPSTSEFRCSTCLNPNQLDGQTAAFIGAMANEKCRRQIDYNYKSSIISFSLLSADSCRRILRGCDSNCRQSLKQKILKYTLAASQPSENNKYPQAGVLWKSDQIAELQSMEDLCDKIEPVPASSNSVPNEPAVAR